VTSASTVDDSTPLTCSTRFGFASFTGKFMDLY